MSPFKGLIFFGLQMEISVENDFLRITADSKGAELVSFFSKKLKKEFLWSGDPKFWQRRSPILFPIVGKLKDNKYKIGDSFFTLNQHGFARDSLFTFDGADEQKISFIFQENEETLKMYPFKFFLRISYKIVGNELAIGADITNKENIKMPFSLGFHPAFVCPFENEEKLNEYCIVFEKEEKCERLCLENGLITGREMFLLKDKILPLSEELFANDAVILNKLLSRKVVLHKQDSERPKIEVDFNGFSYLGLWKKKDARFLCIEPWNGLPDYSKSDQDFFKKEGIIILKEKQIISFKLKIRLLE